MIVIVFGENETNLTKYASDLVCTQDTSEWIDFVTVSTSDWIDNMMDYTDSVRNLLCTSGIYNHYHHLLIVLVGSHNLAFVFFTFWWFNYFFIMLVYKFFVVFFVALFT